MIEVAEFGAPDVLRLPDPTPYISGNGVSGTVARLGSGVGEVSRHRGPRLRAAKQKAQTWAASRGKDRLPAPRTRL
jgi:hypothetical protein